MLPRFAPFASKEMGAPPNRVPSSIAAVHVMSQLGLINLFNKFWEEV
jgi:hypothetical protein